MEIDNQLSAEEVQSVKLRKLERVVRRLLANDPENTQRALEFCGIEDLEDLLSSDDEALDSVAVWDKDDAIYRCPECMWELEQGECGQCGLEFDIDLCDDADYTRNEAVDPDRLSQPRGDTPLRDDGQHPFPPSSYLRRQIEYAQLRQRGATRLMCETFNLEFDAENGIAAWADEDLYGDFAGPLMQKGDFWKIMLGRRIQLEEDDPDGSLFIEALLEDALMFPTKQGPWETVEESPGIWVTRPVYDQPGNPSASASDSGGQQSQSQQDDKLQADYVAPVFAVAAHGYETDAESDEEDDSMAVANSNIKSEQFDDTLSAGEAEEDDDDSSWTREYVDVDGVQAAECSNEDSADSDFDSDSDEVMSGDEVVVRAESKEL